MTESISRDRISPGPLRPGFYRPWRHVDAKPKDSLLNEVEEENGGFKVTLDVEKFKPEEIQVKMLNDVYVIVEGKHEVKQDKCHFVSEEFQRRYLLPETADPLTLKSTFSGDGILTITASKKVNDSAKERIIPVLNVHPTNNRTAGLKPTIATRL